MKMNEQLTAATPAAHHETRQQPRHALAWADRLRNIATLLVIIIHASGSVAEGNRQYDTLFWWSGNIWDSLARPAVPLFVMLSGFLLLGKDYEPGYFLKRRFSRVVVPALFWMLVYSVYNHLVKGTPATVADAIRGIVERPVHYHLWFIYLIIGLYMVYPILRPWVRSASERDYWYFFGACIIGTWVYKILWVFFGISIGIYFELFTNNCGYFVLGYYLGNKVAGGHPAAATGIAPWKISEKQIRLLAVLLILAGAGITAVGTWWASKAYGGVFHPYFYDYLTPNCAMAAAGWFLLAKWSMNKAPLLDIESALAAASFGMYFVHVLVMDWWSQVGYFQTRIHPSVGIPCVVGLIALMAFALITFIRALPGGQKIT